MAEKIFTWIAWRLPKTLAMWTFIRVASYGTVGKYGNQHPDELSIMDALQRWNEQNNEVN
jgi:hypothetical protein